VDLASEALRAVAERNQLNPALIERRDHGCVMQVSSSPQHRPQRRAGCGLAESVPATTIDRQCGSSQQAIHFAAQGVMAGPIDIAVAAASSP